MGSTQSSHAKKHELKRSPKKGSLSLPSDVRGRKSSIVKGAPHGLKASIVSMPSDHFEDHLEEETHDETLHSEEEHHATDEETVDSDYESDEEEEDEEWEERLRILEDARKLKQVAEFFAHPEAPVVGSTGSRCFFDRPSAPERLSREEADEQAAILEDAKALKELATAYHHPEASVVTTDATATGRNYFERPSAPEQETFEEAEERAAIMRDAAALKQAAVDYLHPERPVVVDATATARNYFTRASAPEYETKEEADERDRIMADLKALKQSAVGYLHPERPVEVDAAACGRNYFARPSAPEYETEEDAELRAQVMEDLKMLKQAATDYLHPERPCITTDSTACGRNYFTRASAPEQMSPEEADERAAILADAAALKKTAVDYLHPELSVISTDPTAYGRNYFSRASAPEHESLEDAQARAQVLEDAKCFKKFAMQYRHPELKIDVDDTAGARNYFSRASAPEYESLEDAEVRAQVMEDMKAFKQLALAYRHPELSVGVHATAYGRNYFSRASAPNQENPEEAEERARIMEDLKALKQSAKAWLHPESKIQTTDAFACGRNYFSRPSAPEQMSVEEADERAAIMEDIKALKQSAVTWMHPEAPVQTTDATACARSYFDRPSAPEQETWEEAEERAAILRDVTALKQAAKAYLHPEVGVKTSDPTATGRNYFDRPSSSVHRHMIHTFPPHEDDESEHHHEHLDHFGMDEEMELLHMRQTLAPALEHPGKPSVNDDEEESNLSRSPSSVMLVGLE